MLKHWSKDLAEHEDEINMTTSGKVSEWCMSMPRAVQHLILYSRDYIVNKITTVQSWCDYINHCRLKEYNETLAFWIDPLLIDCCHKNARSLSVHCYCPVQKAFASITPWPTYLLPKYSREERRHDNKDIEQQRQNNNLIYALSWEALIQSKPSLHPLHPVCMVHIEAFPDNRRSQTYIMGSRQLQHHSVNRMVFKLLLYSKQQPTCRKHSRYFMMQGSSISPDSKLTWETHDGSTWDAIGNSGGSTNGRCPQLEVAITLPGCPCKPMENPAKMACPGGFQCAAHSAEGGLNSSATCVPCVYGQYCPVGSFLPAPGGESQQRLDYVDKYLCKYLPIPFLISSSASYAITWCLFQAVSLKPQVTSYDCVCTTWAENLKSECITCWPVNLHVRIWLIEFWKQSTDFSKMTSTIPDGCAFPCSLHVDTVNVMIHLWHCISH